MAEQTLRVHEIYRSIQGESTWAGLPCVFIRLTGCHLRCVYCDTEHAFYDGEKQVLDAIFAEVEGLDCPLVEVTGGEPLLQPNVHPLMTRLCDAGKTVLIETSGACDIGPCDPRVIRIMDLKTPDSGECERNDWVNLDRLLPHDEVKFVIGSRHDYEWSRDVVNKHRLADRVHAILFGAVAPTPPGREIAGAPGLPLHELVRWTLEDGLPVRIQTQLHKVIWPTITRGV